MTTRPASEVVADAKAGRNTVYDLAEQAAEIFVAEQGELFPLGDAARAVAEQLDIRTGKASDIIAHLVEDVADPVTAVRTDDGTYVGVIDYQERDVYYETTQYHDILGQSRTAICAACVDEWTFDHEAARFPDFNEYLRQDNTSVLREGESVPADSTPAQRRSVMGRHFVEAHTDLTPLEVATAATGKSPYHIGHDMGINPKVRSVERINHELSVQAVWEYYGVEFDDVKDAYDLPEWDVTVGASLVSGTTINTNTAIHGGNQGSFNVEDFGTAGAADTVPQSDGAGNLTMSTISGGSGIWSEDANSPLTISASSSGTITLSGQYPVVKVIIESDTSSTAGNHMGLRVNGDTASNYDTRLSGGTTSSDSFVKAVFETGFGSGTEIIMSGEWGTNWSCGVSGGTSGGDTSAVHGSNTNVTSPLDSITFMDDASNNMSITASVYGLST